MSKHTVDYLYFGPLLMKSSIEEDFRLELLKRAKVSKGTYIDKYTASTETKRHNILSKLNDLL